MSPPVLELADVAGGYGDIKVVDSITLTVSPGEVACVTGRNGVGKTTLMRLIAGNLPLMKGSVRFRGQTLAGLKPHQRSRLGIGYAPQEHIVFDDLTVRENLTLHHRDRALERYDRLFETFPRMAERLEQKAGTLSGGERKILSFCRVQAGDSTLVVLDEPSEGVQPENIARMAGIISASACDGKAFVLVEQNLTLVEAVADRVYLIDHGTCVYSMANGPDMRDEIVARLAI